MDNMIDVIAMAIDISAMRSRSRATARSRRPATASRNCRSAALVPPRTRWRYEDEGKYEDEASALHDPMISLQRLHARLCPQSQRRRRRHLAAGTRHL
jgi:hypothetical protein